MPTVNVYSDEPVTINVYPAMAEEPIDSPAAIPEVESVADLAALDASVKLAFFRRPMRTFIFPVPPSPGVPAVDTPVKHVFQRVLLSRSDALQTWAGNGSAGPTQPASYGHLDVGDATTYQEPLDAGWLLPAAVVETAEHFPYGWAPVNIDL